MAGGETVSTDAAAFTMEAFLERPGQLEMSDGYIILRQT